MFEQIFHVLGSDWIVRQSRGTGVARLKMCPGLLTREEANLRCGGGQSVQDEQVEHLLVADERQPFSE